MNKTDRFSHSPGDSSADRRADPPPLDAGAALPGQTVRDVIDEVPDQETFH